MNFTDFARYVLAASKRMTNHFGVPPEDVLRLVQDNCGELERWFKKGVAADKAARVLADRWTLAHHYANECSCETKSNPISTPSCTMFMIGAMVSTAIGVWYLAQASTKPKPSGASEGIPNFSSSEPRVRIL